MKEGFNFKDILNDLGIPLGDKKRNQVAGRILSKWAQENHIQRVHVLEDKTDPNSSVAAPHCICSYPYQYFDEAKDYVGTRIKTDERQLQLL